MLRSARLLPLVATSLFMMGLSVLTHAQIQQGITLDFTPTATTAPYQLWLPAVALEPTPTKTPTPTETPAPTATATATWVPTWTPTPDSTSTATPTMPPALTATTAPGSVGVLPNHSHYVSNIGTLHVLGEVANATNDHLQYVKVALNLFNASNQIIDTSYTYVRLDSLPPGDSSCFDALVMSPAAWSHYEFEAPTYLTGGDPLPNVALFNLSNSVGWLGWYNVVGQARNDGVSRVEYVEVIGTFYGGGGKVAACQSAYVSSTHLDPGQTSSFKVDTYREASAITSYRLQVDWHSGQHMSSRPVTPAYPDPTG